MEMLKDLLMKKENLPSKVDLYTKHKGEQMLSDYATAYGMNSVSLRFFNVAGADTLMEMGQEKDATHIIKNLAIQSLQKKPRIYIYGNNYNTKDGTCVRDYIHVSDLANIHIKSLDYINKKSKSIVLNCGYGKGYSVLDIVNIFKTINKKLIINFTKKDWETKRSIQY